MLIFNFYFDNMVSLLAADVDFNYKYIFNSTGKFKKIYEDLKKVYY